jgi:translation initiation factor 4E
MKNIIEKSASRLIQFQDTNSFTALGTGMASSITTTSGHSTPQQATSPISASASSILPLIHPLHYTWVFWYMHRPPGTKITNYEDAMNKISSFSSVKVYIYLHT